MGTALSFDNIVSEYQDRVYNTCLGFLKNQEEAKDAAQEVFIHVYKNLSRFKGESSLSTWIYRIAVNTCLSEIRKAKRKKRWARFVGLSDFMGEAASAEPFYHPGVEQENRERSALLFQLMDELPEQQRAAFLLHKVEGLPHAEVSRIMGKSLPSIESLIHRAKATLRTKLMKYYEAN